MNDFFPRISLYAGRPHEFSTNPFNRHILQFFKETSCLRAQNVFATFRYNSIFQKYVRERRNKRKRNIKRYQEAITPNKFNSDLKNQIRFKQLSSFCIVLYTIR